MAKKYRDRVEVFGRSKDGKILGGIYSGDKTFGTFGGGIDNDTILQAGKREYKEESGWTLKNVKKIPGKPSITPWYREPGAKGGEYEKKYPDGNRTFFLVGDLHRKGKKASGEDGVSRLQNQRLYSPDEIEKLLAPHSKLNKAQVKRVKDRLKAFKKIGSYQEHTAAGNILIPGESIKKRVKSIMKNKVGDKYNEDMTEEVVSEAKQWMPQ